jgi:hypothetical protein
MKIKMAQDSYLMTEFCDEDESSGPIAEENFLISWITKRLCIMELVIY